MRIRDLRIAIVVVITCIQFLPHTAIADASQRVERALSIMEKFRDTTCISAQRTELAAKGNLNFDGVKKILLDGFSAGIEGELLKEKIIGAVGFDIEELRQKENARIAKCVDKWITRMIERPPEGPTLLMLDSRVPSIAYDVKNAQKMGITNTDKIEALLRGQVGEPNPVFMQIGTTVGWDRVYLVEKLSPDVIIIHWSAFEGESKSIGAVECLISKPGNECSEHFVAVLSDLAILTSAKIVVYSRTPNICREFRKELTKRLADLSSRDVEQRVFLFDMNMRGKSFDNAKAKRDLRNVIRHLLGRDSNFKDSEDMGTCSLGGPG